MIVEGVEYTELKPSLYGGGGLFADIRLRDARHLFSRIIRRRSRGGFMVRYVPAAEVAALRQVVANGTLADLYSDRDNMLRKQHDVALNH
jgi:hypothetical protein